jgi:hypothetical protein
MIDSARLECDSLFSSISHFKLVVNGFRGRGRLEVQNDILAS